MFQSLVGIQVNRSLGLPKALQYRVFKVLLRGNNLKISYIRDFKTHQRLKPLPRNVRALSNRLKQAKP